ncbi:membrane metallo-endopeptidase-like 1 [Thalassophryne amazonica]|uniref:membrane metallo-endopeptidase-like 1 n=1 Tax=Thalassophryne amazonica TaxID=390379 RepID=UPI0014709BC6|nr:membrane metallo-endopeptidase-like 1 [Thalassophryne amazonica]XP_034022124.1 membrane metallo-endopeptidase-like 1 [Thalassophryne amazonica]XP_034022125.1 membrane metallo-endopeptidase-like 1 [Thalassophryne amazonica]
MGKSESQMDIMEKSSKPGTRRWTTAEMGLFVLLLLVSCALAGLIVLYTSAVKANSQLSNRPPPGEGQRYDSNLNNVCTTAECVTTAARLLQNMDESVQPCDNFYQYACGGWLEHHVIPETSSQHSIFDILRDKLEIVLKGALETENEQERDAIRKVKILYSSCMNESLIEQRDSEPLLKLIDTVGDWPVASDAWNTTTEEAWSLEDTLAMLTARFHKKVLLDMYVWTDDRDSLRHIIYVDQPALGMPSRDYYFNNGNYKKVQEAYLHFMVSIAKIIREDRNLSQDDNRVWEEMVQVLDLETDIANATSPAEERQDITVLYQKMTLSELQSTFSFNGFNWTQFLQGVLSSVSINVRAEEEVVVYGAPYLEKMNDVLSRHSVRTMQNYLTWQLIADRVNSLSRHFKDARARYRKALDGTTVEDACWRECVRYVQSSMENAVGALYVRETFAGESKRMVSDLINKIQEAYVETLEELSWMDAPSKEKAREKAMAIKEQIGYPDHILEESNQKLDQEYAHLNFSEEHYFENILENLKSETHKSLKKLREPVDSELWITGVAVVNAFYSHNRNQIVFPAGILQPPFFSKHQLQALNFGGIGMIIGHEITHGFDDNGRNFDKDGNMLNWWSNYSAEHFKEQSQCMVQQYSNFNWKLAGGQNVSGISTLGENIADNGGVRQAYKAYLKWVERHGEELRLPGLDMDHKQLFFLNFAQVWCGAYRPEYASQSIKTDSHSPLEYRVLGSLQNFEAFSEAFQCEKGSPMNPELKCRVW